MSSPETVIEGRPDFENHKFGITRAKRHPKYVYGSVFGSLMHEIAYVEFRWYDVGPGGHSLVRRHHPKVSITTRCGQVFFLRGSNGRSRSTMCELPNPEAILCGRCQGKGPIWGKNSEVTITKHEAKTRLGCADVINLEA